MATKTISLGIEAYERLEAHRRGPGDSFTQIVLRARWEDDPVTARELLEAWKDAPPFFHEEELNVMAEAKAKPAPPADKWNRR